MRKKGEEEMVVVQGQTELKESSLTFLPLKAKVIRRHIWSGSSRYSISSHVTPMRRPKN